MNPVRSMVASDSSIPLYIQIAEYLKEGIESGLYQSGSRLPTEHELSDTYHVSRVTVRKAFALLDEKGYIEKKRGKGTYVAEKKLRRNMSGNVSSFTQMCAAMGSTATARTTAVSLIDAGEELSSRLQLKSGQQALLIERIRYCDDQPVMLETDYFREDFDFLFGRDLNKHSLYQLIRDEMGITFTHASRTIEIVFADSREARLLGVKKGYPLLKIFSITQSENGEYYTVSEQLCIGDKFRLQV